MCSYYQECDQISSIISHIHVCLNGWTTSVTSRSCIKLSESKETWFKAMRECQRFGAHLVIEYNEEKENLINRIVLFLHA